jgi:hypothetical protein
MKGIKYLFALLGEFGGFAATNKAWWLIPIALILLVVAAIITLGGSATPLVYTLF